MCASSNAMHMLYNVRPVVEPRFCPVQPHVAWDGCRAAGLKRSSKIHWQKTSTFCDYLHVFVGKWPNLVRFCHRNEASTTGSFSNARLRLGRNSVSKPFRLTSPSPVLRRNLVNNRCGINRSASPRSSGPPRFEEVAPQLGGKTASKSFRLSKPPPVLRSRLANKHC